MEQLKLSFKYKNLFLKTLDQFARTNLSFKDKQTIKNSINIYI